MWQMFGGFPNQVNISRDKTLTNLSGKMAPKSFKIMKVRARKLPKCEWY